MVYLIEIFVSEVLGKPIIDRAEVEIGRVKDLVVSIGETFPKVTGILTVLKDKKKEAIILMGEIDLIGKQFVTTKATQDRVVFTTLREGELLLNRDVMDKQIVDIEGARVVRVNDLKIAKVGEEVRLIAASIGFRGAARRLGLEGFFERLTALFGRKLPEALIPWNYVEPLTTSLARVKLTIARPRVPELHPADIASIISQVHSEERTAIFSLLSDKTAAEALHELEPKIQAFLLTTIDTKKALSIIEKMPVDEVADVLGDLPEEKTEELLRLMRKRKAEEVRRLIHHHEETAGGLMTTEYIALPQTLTVEETINRIREMAPHAETIYYLYVVDEAERLTGVLSLRNLIIAKPEIPLSEIMVKEVISVEPEVRQKQVADLISKYNLLALPVVDKESKILGIVTVDDVVDFILPPIARRGRLMLG